MLPRSELRESGVLAASDSVVEMLLQMMTSEPRAALRAVLTATNPELSDDELKERLDRASAYISPEAAHDRAEAWIADDPSEPARAVGDGLWILHSEAEPLFEGALVARVAELYPECPCRADPRRADLEPATRRGPDPATDRRGAPVVRSFPWK
jgi:hypothetical protein